MTYGEGGDGEKCRKLALAKNTMMTSDDCLKRIHVSISVPIHINLKYIQCIIPTFNDRDH